MAKAKNEIGNKYGKLLVIEQGGIDTSRHKMWRCQCDCGNIVEVAGSNLRQGTIRSCGCSRGGTNAVDETGNRYGKLIVLEREDSRDGRARWLCQCDCGNKTIVDGPDLRQGKTQSCGCLSSFGEQQILQLLQSKNIPYKKEYWFIDLINERGGHPRFDFALFNESGLVCLIEYQGLQHFEGRGEFGRVQRESTDKLKKEYCIANSIPLYEIRYDEPLEKTLLSILEREKYL